MASRQIPLTASIIFSDYAMGDLSLKMRPTLGSSPLGAAHR
jgi:hypothetical protein